MIKKCQVNNFVNILITFVILFLLCYIMRIQNLEHSFRQVDYFFRGQIKKFECYKYKILTTKINVKNA